VGSAEKRVLDASAAVLYQIGRNGVGATIFPYSAGDLAWLAASGSIAESSDQNQKKDRSIQALDAVLAQYGAISSSIKR